MLRLFLLVLCGTTLSAQDDLAQAAKNPYDLARYLNSHETTAWDRIRQAVGPGSESGNLRGPNCEHFRCSADVVTLAKPSQAIVIIEGPPSNIFLRFFQNGNAWRYAGMYGNFKENYGYTYKVNRYADRLFLCVSNEGIHGSNFDSEYEEWFDLALPTFEPVFGFTVQGYEYGMKVRVSRSVHATATLTSVGPPDAIAVDVDIHYQVSKDIGSARYRATYGRGGYERRFSIKGVEAQDGPAISAQEFEKLANFEEDLPTSEQMLVYALPFLKDIASGSNVEARDWLSSILEFTKDSPERRLLQSTLDQKR